MKSVEKTIKYSVGRHWDQVEAQVSGQVLNRAWDHVLRLVWDQVERQVLTQVEGEVSDQVLAQTKARLKGKL